MTIGSNVLTILNILRGWGNLPASISALSQKLADLKAENDHRFSAIEMGLADLRAEIGVPETGSFNPNPQDPDMSVLQMTVGDAPHTGTLTFSELGAPADGAVQSDNPMVADISLDSTDHASWTITLGSGAATITDPTVVNMTYTGTSDPPDVGPVMVEPLVLTVMPAPVAETGQFNP